MQLFGKLHRSVLLYHITFILSCLSFILTNPSNLICLHTCITVCGCPLPYSWGCKSSGMWHGVVGCGSLHFEGLYSHAFSRDKQFKKNFSWAAWALWWPTTVGTSKMAFPIYVFLSSIIVFYYYYYYYYYYYVYLCTQCLFSSCLPQLLTPSVACRPCWE